MKYSKEQEANAHEMIAKWVNPGDTIYTVLRHVSRSGMQRKIDLYAIKDGTPQWLSGWAAVLLGMPRDDQGIKIGGCGMDMGFELVYNLGRVLNSEGVKCAGDKCASNEHGNGDRDYSGNTVHRDGGYAFHHRWL